jgi:hypothetical protein
LSTTQDVQYIKAGTEAANVGYALQFIDYVAVDAISRGMLHASTQAAKRWIYPTQLLTRSNIGTAIIETDGSVGVSGIASYFKKLWNK